MDSKSGHVYLTPLRILRTPRSEAARDLWREIRLYCRLLNLVVRRSWSEVGAFYWTVPAPDIVNSGREEQGSVSV